MEKDKKMAKKEKKTQALIEKQRKQAIDLSEDEAMLNDDVMEQNDPFEDLEESEPENFQKEKK